VEKKTRVDARLDDFGPNPLETGRFIVNVTPEDADVVYVSESGPPDPANAKKLDGRVYETDAAAAWFLAVDSSGKNKTGDPCEWRAPIRVKPDIRRVSGGHRIAFLASPRSAIVRCDLRRDGPEGRTSAEHARDRCSGRRNTASRCCRVSGQFSPEETAPLSQGSPTGQADPTRRRAPC